MDEAWEENGEAWDAQSFFNQERHASEGRLVGAINQPSLETTGRPLFAEDDDMLLVKKLSLTLGFLPMN